MGSQKFGGEQVLTRAHCAEWRQHMQGILNQQVFWYHLVSSSVELLLILLQRPQRSKGQAIVLGTPKMLSKTCDVTLQGKEGENSQQGGCLCKS
jgi:hypothetical protein